LYHGTPTKRDFTLLPTVTEFGSDISGSVVALFVVWFVVRRRLRIAQVIASS
jgi:hypothetical protein